MLYALPVVVGGWLLPVAVDAGVWVVTLPGVDGFTVVLGLDVTVLRLEDFDAVTKQCASANPGTFEVKQITACKLISYLHVLYCL